MKRQIIIIVVIIAALLGVGGFLYFQQQTNSARAAASARATATVTRGTLTATVNGAGNIYAPQQTNLSFQLTGVPITKVNVQVGDKVKAGDVLALVDDSDLQFGLRTAQSNLLSAQAKLDLLEQPASADDLASAQAQVASAKSAYDSAVAKLQQLHAPPKPADLAAARAAVASEQATYDAAVTKNAHAPDQITVAKAALDKATITLQSAQAAYNLVSWRSDVGMSQQAKDLQQATIDYQSALANYNLALADINDNSVKSAAQSLAQAQANLATLTAAPTAADLASAQAAIDQAAQQKLQADANLTTLMTGATAQDLAQAQASVDSAQVGLDQAKSKLDQAKIIAPFNGTVAAVNYVVGQLSPAGSSTPVLTLVNLDKLQTQITLSEVDIAKVKPDQEVALALDALGGRSVPGKIISVSPVGTITQGVVNYLVTVALTQPDPAIKPGMTTAATITVDRRDNVLLVPNRAIRTQGNQRFITILFEGKEIPVTVTIGLNNDQNSEITSATGPNGQPITLQDGDTVLLNATTTTGANRGGGPGFGGPGGVFLGR